MEVLTNEQWLTMANIGFLSNKHGESNQGYQLCSMKNPSETAVRRMPLDSIPSQVASSGGAVSISGVMKRGQDMSITERFSGCIPLILRLITLVFWVHLWSPSTDLFSPVTFYVFVFLLLFFFQKKNTKENQPRIFNTACSTTSHCCLVTQEVEGSWEETVMNATPLRPTKIPLMIVTWSCATANRRAELRTDVRNFFLDGANLELLTRRTGKIANESQKRAIGTAKNREDAVKKPLLTNAQALFRGYKACANYFPQHQTPFFSSKVIIVVQCFPWLIVQWMTLIVSITILVWKKSRNRGLTPKPSSTMEWPRGQPSDTAIPWQRDYHY